MKTTVSVHSDDVFTVSFIGLTAAQVKQLRAILSNGATPTLQGDADNGKMERFAADLANDLRQATKALAFHLDDSSLKG